MGKIKLFLVVVFLAAAIWGWFFNPRTKSAVDAAAKAREGYQVSLNNFGLVEVKVGASAIKDLENPDTEYMTVSVPPSHGFYLTMDAGEVKFGETIIFGKTEGVLLGFYNSGSDGATLTLKTGWNESNKKWNAFGSIRAGAINGFFEYCFSQQFSVPTMDKGEMKPNFILVELSNGTLEKHDSASYNPYTH